MKHFLFLLLFLLTLASPVWAQSPSQLSLGSGLMQGLAYWWRALPGLTGGTTFYDLGPYQNHGTLSNMGATATSGWNVTERPGGSLHLAFDGTDDYVLTSMTLFGGPVGPAETPAPLPFSLCAWVWVQTAPAAGNEVALVGVINNGGTFDGSSLRIVNSSGNLLPYLFLGTGVGTFSSGSTITVSVQRWHHACGTYTGNGNSTGMMVYVNGQLSSVGASSTITGNWTARALSLGGDYTPSAGNLLNGKLDDVRVWRRALSLGEVRQVFLQSQQGDADLFGLGRGMAMGPLVGTPGGFFQFFQ